MYRMNALTVYIKYLPAEVQILFVSVYNQPFEVKKVVENWKYKEWPQTDLEHSAVKNTLYMYILCTHTRVNLHN